MLKLYHGSNEKVISPNIHTGRNPLDFGKGFYKTETLDNQFVITSDKASKFLVFKEAKAI